MTPGALADLSGHFYFRLVLSLVTLSRWMGGVVEADPVWHRPVGPSQPFRAGDSPTPKGGRGEPEFRRLYDRISFRNFAPQ